MTELEQMARNTVALQRATGLAEFIGEGRGLTQTGNLKLADGPPLIELLGTNDRFNEVIGDRTLKTRSTTNLPGVNLTFRLAVESQILRRRKTKVVPGSRARLLADDPLEALYGMLLALMHQIGPTRFHYSGHSYGWDWYADDLDEEVPAMLLELYRHGGHEIEELADRFWDLEMSRYECRGARHHPAGGGLCRIPPERGATMNREQFEHAVRAAAAVAGVSEIQVIGSQAVHASMQDIPDAAMRSVEVDIVIPGDVDGTQADLVDGSIGEASIFHETFGFNALGVSIETAVLADEWESRLVRYQTPATNGVVAWCLSLEDLFVSKGIVGRPKDLEFCRSLLSLGAVDVAQIRHLLDKVVTVPAKRELAMDLLHAG